MTPVTRKLSSKANIVTTRRILASFIGVAIWRLVLMAGLPGACVGRVIDGASIAEAEGNPGPAGSGGIGAGGAGKTGAGGDITAPPAEAKPGKVCGAFPNPMAGPGPAPLRRLTRFEYNNTVTDLLGDLSNPASGFAQEGSVLGFDNNANNQVVTSALAEDYFEAAVSLARRALGKLNALVPCDTARIGDEVCARTFIASFGQRAFRRPLTTAEITRLMDIYTGARQLRGGDHLMGMKHVIANILQSFYFLYRGEFGDPASRVVKGIVPLTPWEMSARLSYFLWSSMPDAALFAVAEANMLRTPDQVKAQAQRMLQDPKARRMVARFHEQWLALAKLDNQEKDLKLFPNFASVRGAMKEETTRFVEDAFWQADGAVGALFTSNTSFMNQDLAAFLKMPGAVTAKAGFQKVTLPAERLGLLSQASLLATYAKPDDTSPVLRGKFILEHMLCIEVPPPPPDVMATNPPARPGQTTRQRFADHAKEACATCHRIMDPVGFAFENFDAAGRLRTMDNGKPVDTAAELATGTDVDGALGDGVDLSKRLAGSAQMKRCVATNWFRLAFGRAEAQLNEKSLEQLFCAFEASNFNMPGLLLGLTQTEAFLGRPARQEGIP